MPEGQEVIPAGAPLGRPLSFSWDVANDILDRIADGQSLRSICCDPAMPGQTTVFRWLRSEEDWAEDFRQQYARAREDQADTIADEQLDIADDASNDWMERRDKDGNSIGWELNGEHIQRSKLRIETRKWLAGKLKPKKYGEKLDLTSDHKPINADAGDVAARAAALLAIGRERKDGAK